ncbi:MAG: hypothetical protein Q9182_002011 [Xanthomendoza sp. 2 TL-2023]
MASEANNGRGYQQKRKSLPIFATQPRARQNPWQWTTQALKFFFPPTIRVRNVRVMKLYLIRHGETVDNIAQVYAGVRDSPLTVQGVLQAERLGHHLAAGKGSLTHIFASDLQRAVRTADALLSAQSRDGSSPRPTVKQLPVLREQNFGFYEGKAFYTRQQDSRKSGKDHHRLQHQDEPGFQDVESKESMIARTNLFVAKHLRPLILGSHSEHENIVAIVSHGIILSHLWRSILSIFSKHTVALAPGLPVGGGGATQLEHLGGWSNTGYLELDITFSSADTMAESRNTAAKKTADPSANEVDKVDSYVLPSTFKMLVKTINGNDHLKGLKRARGVGSAQHDERQKKIEMFFKKTKVS